MKLDIYLNYAGNCQQAFRFYEQHLGGKITMLMTHGQGPNAATLSAEQKSAILLRAWKPSASTRFSRTVARSS